MTTTKFIKTESGRMYYPVGNNLQRNKDIVKSMAKAFIGIKEYREVGVNLWCMGSSGSIAAALFSEYVPNLCDIVYIRKEGEFAHMSYSYTNSFIDIIIDDFISSGATINTIYDRIVRYRKNEATIIDALIFSGDCTDGLSKRFPCKYIIASY